MVHVFFYADIVLAVGDKCGQNHQLITKKGSNGDKCGQNHQLITIKESNGDKCGQNHQLITISITNYHSHFNILKIQKNRKA